MRLFLTVSSPTSAGAARESTSPDTIAIFDDGVWTRSGPSRDAVEHTPVASVARKMHRRAALTKLIQSSANDVVCFRYGPRPSPPQDVAFFHKRSLAAVAPSKTLATRAILSADSTGMSSTLITASTSLSSARSARSLLSSLDKSPAPTTFPQPPAFTNAVYDSFMALWLLEAVATEKQHVIVTGCLFFVDGATVDLSTRQDLYAPPTMGRGAARVLRCHDDVHSYLAQCELSIQEATRRRGRHIPYHMWITARVGSGADTPELPAVTFLDLAHPPDSASGHDGGDNEAATRAGEQLLLFHRQLGASAFANTAAAAPQPLPTAAHAQCTADRRWVGVLQSCQLSRADLVGMFCFTQRGGKGPFRSTTNKRGCDPFMLSAELRQRALKDAVNHGILHPSLSSSSRRARASAKKRAIHNHMDDGGGTPLKSISIKAVSPASLQLESILENTTVLPSLKRVQSSSRSMKAAAAPGEATHNARSGGFASFRTADFFALLEAEERAARAALHDSEAHARELTWMRWALRAHPPNTSLTAVARQLSSAVSRLERAKMRSAPLKRPPPLQQADLAATARVPSVHHRGSPSSTARITADSPHVRSPEVVLDYLPILTPAASVSRAFSTATSPSNRRSAATSAASRRGPHPEFLIEVVEVEDIHRPDHRHHNLPSGAGSPQASTSSSRAVSGRRRYSAVEVVVLERVQSGTRRSSSAGTPHSGSDVELLYPLVRSYHAEVVAQDAVMAKEMMARSKIELREMNRRRTLEKMQAERSSAASPAASRYTSNGRRYSASPRVSRAFFDA